MFTDFVLNGVGHGEVGTVFQGMRYDPGMLRPFIDQKGVPSITVNTGRMVMDNRTGQYVPKPVKVSIEQARRMGLNSPVWNAASLRKEEWQMIDRQVLLAARSRLVVAQDLMDANTYGGFNGMAKMTLEYEAMSDPGQVYIDMDARSSGASDAPLFKLRSIPLPITHVDFTFSERRLAVSRNTGSPLDMTMPEAGARRIGESLEQQTLGTATGMTYGTVSAGPTAHDGNSTVYGYTTFSARLTKTNLTTPTGTNPNVTLAEVLAMKDQLTANKFYGPWMLYHSDGWDQFMDNDYYVSATGAPYVTLRERLKKINGIVDVKRADFLTQDYQLLMVQMTADVARMIVGLPITTVQWPEKGGLEQCFKIMCIIVPQLRSDYNGNCGILHAQTAALS